MPKTVTLLRKPPSPYQKTAANRARQAASVLTLVDKTTKSFLADTVKYEKKIHRLFEKADKHLQLGVFEKLRDVLAEVDQTLANYHEYLNDFLNSQELKPLTLKAAANTYAGLQKRYLQLWARARQGLRIKHGDPIAKAFNLSHEPLEVAETDSVDQDLESMTSEIEATASEPAQGWLRRVMTKLSLRLNRVLGYAQHGWEQTHIQDDLRLSSQVGQRHSDRLKFLAGVLMVLARSLSDVSVLKDYVEQSSLSKRDKQLLKILLAKFDSQATVYESLVREWQNILTEKNTVIGQLNQTGAQDAAWLSWQSLLNQTLNPEVWHQLEEQCLQVVSGSLGELEQTLLTGKDRQLLIQLGEILLRKTSLDFGGITAQAVVNEFKSTWKQLQVKSSLKLGKADGAFTKPSFAELYERSVAEINRLDAASDYKFQTLKTPSEVNSTTFTLVTSDIGTGGHDYIGFIPAEARVNHLPQNPLYLVKLVVEVHPDRYGLIRRHEEAAFKAEVAKFARQLIEQSGLQNAVFTDRAVNDGLCVFPDVGTNGWKLRFVSHGHELNESLVFEDGYLKKV